MCAMAFAPKKPKPQMSKPTSQSQPEGEAPMPQEGGENQDIHQVVSQHGPATETHTMHNHEAGEHQMTSTHKDGHKHHSKHGSAMEAHKDAEAASGADQGEDNNENSMEEPMQKKHMAQPAMSGSIPGY